MHALVNEWRWSLTAADYSPRTISDHTGFASRFLVWLGQQEVGVGEATRQHAEQWLASLPSATQRRKAVFALKGFARWAEEEEVSPNFAARLKTPKVQVKPQHVITSDDIDALLAACTGRSFTATRDAAVISVLASTGVRRSELERMRVVDVDLDTRTIVIPTAKNGSGRLTFLDAPAARLVARYLRERSAHPHTDDERLWLGREGAITADGVMQALHKRGHQAGVKVSLHAFRRAYAHRWYLAGGSTAGLMASAGWTDHAMPSRYLKSVAGDLARVEHERIFDAVPKRTIKRRRPAA